MALEKKAEQYSIKTGAVLMLWPVAVVFLSVFIPVSFFVLHDNFTGYMHILALITIIVSLLIHSKNKNTTLISNIFASLGIPVILPWLISGGPANSGLWYSLPYLCWMFSFTKKKWTIFWVATYVGVAGLIVLLSAQGFFKIAYSSGELLNILFAFAITFAIIYLFDYVRDYQVKFTDSEIAERRKSEEQLKIANDQLFVFFNLNPVATYISNTKDGRFKFVNEAFLKLFSFERNEVIGKNAVEINLMSTEEQQRIIKQIKDNNAHLRGEAYKFKNKDGKTLDILGSNEKIILDGEIHFIGTMQDITPIKETEEKLRKLIEFQRIIFDGTDYSVITTRPEDGIITTFNKGAEKMLGYSVEEVVGKMSPQQFHDEQEVNMQAKKLSEELQQEVKPGMDVFHIKSRLGFKTDSNEWTYIRKDGSRITVELSVSILKGKENSIFGYLGIAKDITESKKLQHELVSAKLIAEQSVKLKEAFLANMSHEIRTPMNAIIGFTDLLLKRNLQEQELDYVETIKKSGENLLRIINDILDVSKIDSGMMTFETYPISIKEIFGSLQIMLSQKAKEKNLTLSFQYDDELPDTVLGDPTRLTQIILNLAGNAIKFTKTGEVIVNAQLLKETPDSYEIKFLVKDTGIGISEDKLQSVFERFNQAESHTTRNYGGTGLGLSIAKQLVKLQGGTITADSIVGKGSIFSFSLSFKKTNEKHVLNPAHFEKLNTERLSDLSILLVEDNPINIKFVKSLFETYHISADIAENGILAIEKIKNCAYDLILMDIEMPEMNGYEATRVIRNELKSNIPIIAMTAHAMAGEQEKCIRMGMNNYISKPIHATLLFEKMLTAVSDKTIAKKQSSKKEKIIDLDFLIKSMQGKKEIIKETIDVILDQIPKDILLINEAVIQHDFISIKDCAHRMKSTSFLIGVKKVVSILMELEELGKEKKEMEKIKLLNGSLTNLLEQAVEEIQTERLNFI